MSVWEQIKQAINPATAQLPLAPEDTAFDDEKLQDDKALAIVLSDADEATRYISGKALPAEWNKNEDLYRAYVQPKNWPGANEARAHLSIPLVQEVIGTLLPQTHLAFFSDKTPFILSAQGTTSPDTARAAAKILKWAVKCSGFKEEIRKIQKSCYLHGVGVGMWGWQQGEEEKRKYEKEGGNVVRTSEPKRYSRPTFEYVELKNLLVDPSLRTPDIRDAAYVIRQRFITANDLDEMRDDETYKNVPTRQQLRVLLTPTSQGATDSLQASKVESWREYQAQLQRLSAGADPLAQPLELLEYWTKERVILVLQRCVIIRNEENPYERLPFVSAVYDDVLGSFYGFGIAKIISGEQVLQTGITNKYIDSLDLSLSPAFHRKKGTTAGQQNQKIAPGKVINDDGELAPIPVPSIAQEALTAVQMSDARARRRVGANFGPDMPTQAMRTAEGVQEFTSGIQTKTQYFVENFAEFVFIPVLEAFIAQAKDNMTPDDIDDVLTEEEGHSFDGDHLNFYNGLFGIEVLSSTKLAAKRAMVSLIPTLMQLFSAAPVQEALQIQGKKLDLGEFINQVIDLTGWDAPGLIIPMTPHDQQRAMMMNPAVQKAQSEMMLQNQQHQNDMELEGQKSDARAGAIVIKHALDRSEPEEPLATRPANE